MERRTFVSGLSRIVAEAQRSLRAQVERVRVLACQTALDRGPPSALVDYHALRLLVKHLSGDDVAFLRRSLGSPRIDLEEIRSQGEPSLFSHMLWVMALDRLWGQPMLRQVEYVLGAQSFKMELDLTCAPECTYYAEDPTPSLTRLLRLGGEVLYDIGANVGFHALTGSMFFGESHAFEPTPQTLGRLRKNVAMNPDRRVTVHGVGLSARDGQARLFVHEVHPGVNTLVSGPSATGGEAVDVSVFRLDNYRKAQALPGPSVIKIDVEGHECEVLEGAQETIEAFRPTIFVEVQSMKMLEQFANQLPRSYELYILPTRGALVPASLQAPFGRDHDFLFVDGARRELLERRLSGSWTGSGPPEGDRPR